MIASSQSGDLATVWPRARPFALALLAVLGACTTASRYEVLSFFFNGVPDPNAPLLAADRPTHSRKESVVPRPPMPPLHIHAPYAERACDKCHLRRESKGRTEGEFTFRMRDLTALKLPLQELCVSCHPQASRSFEHAPVLLGECAHCHHPHAAPQVHLLRRPRVRELCVTCHTSETMIQTGHYTGPADQDCSDCHDPHGGAERYYLRTPRKQPEPQRQDPPPAAAAEGRG